MKVLIVRPAPSCYELVNSLQCAGIDAIAAPLLSFTKSTEIQTLASELDSLAPQSIVIAVSPRAVEYACHFLNQKDIHWRADLRYVAIGNLTAQVWKKYSQISAITPKEAHSEGVLALNIFSSIKETQVLILRGNGGREHLATNLSSRGADVRYFETYHRLWDNKKLLLLAKDWQQQEIDTIAVTSGEQLALLNQGLPSKQQQWLQHCDLLVPSQRIATQAHSLGFKNVISISGASNQALFDAIQWINNPGKSDE